MNLKVIQGQTGKRKMFYRKCIMIMYNCKVRTGQFCGFSSQVCITTVINITEHCTVSLQKPSFIYHK